MLGGFTTAAQTLTSIPLRGATSDNMAASLYWFPAVGGLLGIILYLLWLFLSVIGLEAWAEGQAFVIVAASIVLTRGLHLDGLADWADAFFSLTCRERMLEIMKDSCLGTFGVLAIVLSLSLKWMAIVRLIELDLVYTLVAAYIVSRTVQVELAVCLPYAREQEGMGGPFISGAKPRHRIVAWILAAATLFAIGPFVPLVLTFGFVVSHCLGGFFKRRLGGVTGDLLGASSEITETSLLALFAAVGKPLAVYTIWGTS